jgi:hypothetical protein
LETLRKLLAATSTVVSRKSMLNADLLQEPATNSLDAKELLLLDSAELPSSRDQTPDASSQEPPRENVTEVVFANKLKSLWRERYICSGE